MHNSLSVYRVFGNICGIPGIIQLLIDLGNNYNIQALLSLLLKQMIPQAVTECLGDEPSHYFTLLSELLQTVDLDSTLVDTMIRFVSELIVLHVLENLLCENFSLFMPKLAGKGCYSLTGM